MQTLCLRHYDQLLRVIIRRFPIRMERHVFPEEVLQKVLDRGVQNLGSLQPIGPATRMME